MFRGKVAFLVALFLGVATLLLRVHLTGPDRLADEIIKAPALKAEQTRSFVSKDFWLPGPQGRQHARFQGDLSQLTFTMRRGKVEGVEKLTCVHAETSEGLCFQAEQGIYSYPAHHFLALDAHLESAGLLKGRAQRIELPLTTLQMVCSGGVELDAEKERLHLEADLGRVFFDHSFGLSEIHCEGAVRLRRDETYALAKEFSYFALQQLAILSCPSPERVLFWQQSARLSAPEVRLKLDSGKVEGAGDVHFSFDLEEQNLFDSIFAKYL